MTLDQQGRHRAATLRLSTPPRGVRGRLRYNSKVYYIVTDGAGFVMQSIGCRQPATKRCWTPSAKSAGCRRRRPRTASGSPGRRAAGTCPTRSCRGLERLVRCGETATNYQLLPGDRLYVMAQPIITVDTYWADISLRSRDSSASPSWGAGRSIPSGTTAITPAGAGSKSLGLGKPVEATNPDRRAGESVAIGRSGRYREQNRGISLNRAKPPRR